MFNEYGRFDLQSREIPPEVEKAFASLFNDYKKSMFTAAVNAEKRAEHYSKVHVGCAMIILNKDLDLARPELVTGANTKHQSGMLAWPERECAETRGLLNALNISKPGSVEDPRWKEQVIEKGSLKEGGVVAAVLTVSKNRNTGELDRADHDVLMSCNQCVVNYEGLLKLGIVSTETIIYNARIEDGKEVAFIKQTLGQLLDDFHKAAEKRNESSMADLLEVKNKSLEEYSREISNINIQFGSPSENPVPPIMPSDPYKVARGYQRERVEAIYEAIENCLEVILGAAKSAAEEGLPKELIVQSLGLKGVSLDADIKGFNKTELNLISAQLERLLQKISRQ